MSTAVSATFEAEKIGFSESVTNFFKKYWNFSGRANRAEYIYAYLFIFVASILMGVSFGLLGQSIPRIHLLVIPLYLLLVIPLLSLSVRRFHDFNRSGWWLLASFVPVLGWLVIPVLCLVKGVDKNNRFSD